MMNAISIRGVGITFQLKKNRRVSAQDFLFHAFSRNHTKTFWALKDISLDIQQGEVLGVIGPNGSGKTTLLRVIAGIYTPQYGAVRVNGSVSALLTITAGFQNDLTGLENVYVNAILQGMTKREIDKALPDIVEFSEISAFIDQPVRTYSQGMRARLGFSIAVHAKGDILLIDEVLGVGDQRFQRKARAAMSDKLREGRTVVLVTHNLDWIRQHSQRVLWLNEGEIVGIGEPEKITAQYEESYQILR